jgi:ATP-dependent Clp protease protease subunit|tara:strand:- start:469 stop:1032 length:564 start_codon:yes stop_codon:yes gene_type:complete
MKRYENHSAEDRADNSLFDNDIHYLNGELNEENIAKAIKWILSANLQKKPKRKLVLYVNTVGGDLYESFALIDVMKSSHHNVSTIGIGAVMSAGFLIFASGKQGERYIGKNTGIMNHQHSDTMDSKMHDMKAQMKENGNCEQRCMQILREATGMSVQEVNAKFIKNPSDQYYTAKQLVDLKVADHIL